MERGEYLAPDGMGILDKCIGTVRYCPGGTHCDTLQKIVEENERIEGVRYFPEGVHGVDERVVDI
jgi:hypothetical protein